jgi:hypothetical protein
MILSHTFTTENTENTEKEEQEEMLPSRVSIVLRFSFLRSFFRVFRVFRGENS